MRPDDLVVRGVARRQPTVMWLPERPIRKWFGAGRARYLLATFLAGALAAAGAADLPAAATAESLVG